ncbi:hypothetical protein B0H19DRAFT_1183088 [Mycena capillaripes]|nr:hypothetical protein B0H19DRAFT_1183088 [Mycena capillaripes]
MVQQGLVTVGVVPGVDHNVNTQWKIARALQSRLEQPFGDGKIMRTAGLDIADLDVRP